MCLRGACTTPPPPRRRASQPPLSAIYLSMAVLRLLLARCSIRWGHSAWVLLRDHQQPLGLLRRPCEGPDRRRHLRRAPAPACWPSRCGSWRPPSFCCRTSRTFFFSFLYSSPPSRQFSKVSTSAAEIDDPPHGARIPQPPGSRVPSTPKLHWGRRRARDLLSRKPGFRYYELRRLLTRRQLRRGARTMATASPLWSAAWTGSEVDATDSERAGLLQAP